MKRLALLLILAISTLLPAWPAAAQSSQTPGDYTYDDSGNVESIGPDDDGMTNYFDYDSAGRLIQFVRRNQSTTVITETYQYDAYGNLTKQTTNGVDADFPAAASTNRLTGATYDALGNVTARGTEAYLYDAVGTLTRRSGTWGDAIYIYTADDERVAIGGPDGTWRYMARDLDGKVLREWSAPSWNGAWSWVEDYVYRDGTLVAGSRPPSQGGDRHFHLDHLGSPRMITNSSATTYAEHAYSPFGREITSPTQEIDNFGHDTPEPMKFTGHERNFAGSYTGTALDYMHARYYDPQAGRFLSVDPKRSEVLAQPQKWNRYTYTKNNPLVFVDPNGQDAISTRIAVAYNKTLNFFSGLGRGLVDTVGWGNGLTDTEASNTKEFQAGRLSGYFLAVHDFLFDASITADPGVGHDVTAGVAAVNGTDYYLYLGTGHSYSLAPVSASMSVGIVTNYTGPGSYGGGTANVIVQPVGVSFSGNPLNPRGTVTMSLTIATDIGVTQNVSYSVPVSSLPEDLQKKLGKGGYVFIQGQLYRVSP